MLQVLRCVRCGCVIKPRLLLLAARHNKQACSALARRVGFRRLRRTPRFRLRCRLQSLRLHYLIQVHSAGPALTCEDGWHRAFIRGSVPEPERPSSLARTFVRPAPDAPVGLSARSAEDRKNDVGASPFQTSSEPSGGIFTRFSGVDDCSVFARAKVLPGIYKWKDGSRRDCAPGLAVITFFVSKFVPARHFRSPSELPMWGRLQGSSPLPGAVLQSCIVSRFG